MSELSDEALMERVQQGDSSVLGLLMRRYERPLYALAWRMLGDRAAAEDAFQETFLRVLRKRGSYRKGATFRPWLYQICLNYCRDELRRRGRRPEAELAEDLPLPDPEPGPAERAQAEAKKQRIREAVETLPDKQREVFLLVHYQGMAYGEAAEVVGIPPGTVKSRMFYALRYLAGKLLDLDE